jgi:hypothetical protein
MKHLIFLYNELLNPLIYHDMMRLPLDFICFGIIDGKMYTHFRNKSVFVLPYNHLGKWGNTKIYGAVFTMRDFSFYIDLLDAYHISSKSRLKRNHSLDLHHRKTVDVTPIHFSSLDDLSRLKYRESEITLKAETYLGNSTHPKIKDRYNNKIISRRVIDGIDKYNFKELYRRVKYGL